MRSLSNLAMSALGLSALVAAQEPSTQCVFPGQPTSGEINMFDFHALVSTWCAILEPDHSVILRQMGMIQADRQLTEGSAVVRLAYGWPEDCEQDSPDQYDAANPIDGVDCMSLYVDLFFFCNDNGNRGGTFNIGCAEWRYEAL